MNADPGPWGVVLGALIFGAIVTIAWVVKKAKRQNLQFRERKEQETLGI